MNTALDHLVVIADTLDAGVAWCEATLGLTPAQGGSHPLMGTHNRLLRIDAPGFAGAYLEIIAIDPRATPQRQAPLRRWFDMDDAALMAQVRQHGPQLLHWVARTSALDVALAISQQHGWQLGPALAASRPTPQGLLQWRISVRDDGQRLLGGVLPTLIEWGDTHPSAALPASPLRLHRLTLQHPQAPALRAWAAAVGLQHIHWVSGPPALQAEISSPLGLVRLGQWPTAA